MLGERVIYVVSMNGVDIAVQPSWIIKKVAMGTLERCRIKYTIFNSVKGLIHNILFLINKTVKLQFHDIIYEKYFKFYMLEFNLKK